MAKPRNIFAEVNSAEQTLTRSISLGDLPFLLIRVVEIISLRDLC